MQDFSYLIGNQHAKGSPPNQTCFKKGNVPLNKMPVNSITVRVDKNGTMRSWIKIAEPKEWVECAKFVWMQCNGDIPDGLLVHHIDKNPMNDDPANLQLATRAEHINLHRTELRPRAERLAQGVFNLTPA